MKKNINLFGKKIPILAIMLVMLIASASAALFTHYAVLSGDIEVTSDVWVSDSNGIDVDIDGTGDLDFSSPATFEIHNIGDLPVMVRLEANIMQGEDEIENYDGFEIEQSLIEDHSGWAIVPPGGVVGTVELIHSPFVVPDTYTLVMEFDPDFASEADYHDHMSYVTLTHKNEATLWSTYGLTSSLGYVAMGNQFYYELDANDLESVTDYSLIYYADPWPGTEGFVIGSFTTDVDGNQDTSGVTELGMSLPTEPDNNFGDGAKVWVVLSSHLTNGNSMPMVSWDSSEYLFEYSEILADDTTDLVQYTDTNLV